MKPSRKQFLIALVCFPLLLAWSFSQEQARKITVTAFPPLSTKESAFLIHCSRSPSAVIQGLLKDKADPNERSLGGQSALMVACLYNTDEVVKLLVDAGGDVNLPDYSDYTPLMAAAARGSTKIISLLLEKGANLEARTRFGDTPLHVALGGIWWIPTGVVAPGQLIGSSANAQVIPLQLEAAKQLLQAGANPHATDSSGQNLLVKLAIRGMTNGLSLLTENGLELEKRDEAGMTALMWAIVYGQEGAIRELVRMGADLNATGANGKTGLELLRMEEPETIRLVTERGTLTRRLRHPPNRKELISLLESMGAK